MVELLNCRKILSKLLVFVLTATSALAATKMFILPNILRVVGAISEAGSEDGVTFSAQEARLAYVYDLNTNITANMSSATETGATQAKSVYSGLKGRVRITPTALPTEFLLQLEDPLEVEGSDDVGNVVPQPLRAEVRVALMQAIKVVQQSDGSIAGIQFPETYAGLSEEEVLGVKNALRGVASLYDYRNLQPNTSLDGIAEDPSGKYQAHYTRGTEDSLVRTKSGYTEYAPGTGLFDVSDGSDRLVASTLAHTGETRIQFDGNHRIQSVVLNDGIRLEGGGSPVANAEFAVNGTNTHSARLSLVAREPLNSATRGALPTVWGRMESLRSESGCKTSSAGPEADEEFEARYAAFKSMPDPAGQGIHLARVIKQSGSARRAVQGLFHDALSPEARRELLFALGMFGSPEAQEALAQVALDPKGLPALRGQALLSLEGQAHPTGKLVESLEAYAFGSDAPHPNLAKFVVGSLAGKLGPDQDPLRQRILQTLATRLLQARTAKEKALMLTAIAASRDQSLRPMVEMAAEDAIPAVKNTAKELLEAMRSTTRGPELPANPPNFRDCNYHAKELKLNTGDPANTPIRCWEGKHLETGDLGFLNAGISYGAVGGMTLATDKTPSRVASRVFVDAAVRILGWNVNIFELTADGIWDWQNEASDENGFHFEKAWFGIKWPKVDWYSATQESTGEVDLGARGKGYKWCGAVGPFIFCLEVGIQLDTKLDQTFSGKTLLDSVKEKKMDELGAQRAVFFQATPSGRFAAWVEGRVQFVCLKLRVRLEGSFLIHRYPVRLVIDYHDASHAGAGYPFGFDPFLIDACILADESRQAWKLDLVGIFDYCIKSKTYPIWSAGGPEHKKRLLTYCGRTCDLAVKEFGWTTEKPCEGLPLEMNLTVVNKGTQSTTPFAAIKARLYDGGTLVAEGVFKDAWGNAMRLWPNQEASLKLVWPNPTQGNHNLVLKLDEEGFLYESDQANNVQTRSLFIYPKLLDYTISKVSGKARPDGDIDLTMEFRNLGGKSAISRSSIKPMGGGATLYILDYFPVKVQISSAGTPLATVPAAYTSATFASLDYNQMKEELERQTKTITIPGRVNGVPVQRVDLSIDPDNQYEEVSEANNSIRDFDLGIVIQDITPPVAGVPTVGGSIGQIPVSAAASDNIGVAKVEFLVNNVVRATAYASQPFPVSGTFSTTFDSSLLTDGTYNLVAKAYDGSGNASASGPRSFTIANQKDQTAPTVASPVVNGSGGNLSFTASAQDNVGVTRLEFWIDSTLAGTLTSASGTLWKDSSAWRDGQHTVLVVAFDAAGNRGQSPVVSFQTRNDYQVPSVSVSVLGGSGMISLTARATDNQGIGRVEFLIDNQSVGALQGPGPDFSLGFDSSRLANGSHTLVARAYDFSENLGIAQANFQISNTVADLQAPAVTASVGGSTGTFSLGAQATDNVGVVRVEFLVDGALVASQSGAGPAFSASWNSTQVPNGSHTLTVKAYDAAGNCGSASTSFLVANGSSDATPPVLSNLRVVQRLVRARPYRIYQHTLYVDASDNVGVVRVEFFLDGNLVGSRTAAPYSLNLGSRSGVSTLSVTAYDAAGNQSSLSIEYEFPDPDEGPFPPDSRY